MTNELWDKICIFIVGLIIGVFIITCVGESAIYNGRIDAVKKFSKDKMVIMCVDKGNKLNTCANLYLDIKRTK